MDIQQGFLHVCIKSHARKFVGNLPNVGGLSQELYYSVFFCGKLVHCVKGTTDNRN